MNHSKTKDIEIRVKKELFSDFFGAYNSKFNGNGLEFRDLRQYVFGDSIRRIDWKTTAKYHETSVKNYEEERDLQILFVLDISETMLFGSKIKTKFDTLLELVYCIGLSAIHAGDSIGAYIYTGKVHKFIDFGKGEEVLYKIAKSIEEFSHISKNNKSGIFQDLHLKNMEKLAIKNSFVLFCSDHMGLEQTGFKRLSSRNELLYCNIHDSFENELWDESPLIHISSTPLWFQSVAHMNSKRKRYASQREKQLHSLKHKLMSQQIAYLEFNDTVPVVQTFLKYFYAK